MTTFNLVLVDTVPEGSLALAFWETLDAAANLAYCDSAHIQAAFVFPQPSYHVGIGHRFDRFAEDIRVHQIAHNAGGSESSGSRSGISN